MFDLRSLTLADIAGNLANFSDVDRSWTVLTTTGGITGFDAAHWTILTGQFTTETPWAGSWSISQSGSDLVLNYNAIPEPSTATIALMGAGVAYFFRRRNSRSA